MSTRVSIFLLSAFLTAGGRAAEGKPTPRLPSFELPGGSANSADSRFTPAQVAFVQSWIRQAAPECPVEGSAAVAQAFLEELAANRPDQLDRLLDPDFSTHALDSMLLRQAGAKLSGSAQAAAREKIAERRVTALLVQEGRPAAEAAGLLGKIREASAVQYRRLLEARIEDDDLLALLRKAGRPNPAPAVTPKELSAAEIVSEFVRHNQTGAAMNKLQSFVATGDLTIASGEKQHLVMSKMRPDLVRLVVLQDGLTKYVLAADRDRFWRQVPGQAAQYKPGQAMGEERYLAEFADPFFVGEGYAFERLADGTEMGKPFYRVSVRRADGSGYIARIEPGAYRQIGRENPDKSVVRYSDFREIAGVIFAFREEVTDAKGRSGVLTLARVAPNPGLIEEYFIPPHEPGLDYYQVEKFLAGPTGNVLFRK